jgi:hypothetical protein
MTKPSYIDLEKMVRAMDTKITRMEKGRHKQDLREGRLTARITELEESLAAMEAANKRLQATILQLRGQVS